MMEVSVNWNKNMEFKAKTQSGHEVMMDAPPAAGGKNSAARPTELLLAGVGGCSSMDIVETMTELGQELKSLTVEVKGERPTEYPMPFTDLYLHYIVEGNVDPEVLRKAITESMELYCAAGLSLLAKKTFTFEINGVQY